MEHVRLDDKAHREIYRVLKLGGFCIFTLPHERSYTETMIRCEVVDPDDPSKDTHILEPEYHGDTNNEEGKGVLSYRVYGLDLDQYLENLEFRVEYSKENFKDLGIINTELYFCRKIV